MFHGSDCRGYRGSSAAGSSERFIADVLIGWKEDLLLIEFSFYCRKSPAEISHVDLQEKSLLAAMGAGVSHLSCTPLSWQGVLSQALRTSSMLALAKVTQKLPRISLLMQWFCLTAPRFAAGKEASVVIGGGVSGRRPGQKCFAVEQSWAIDPGSTLGLNLEIWRHKSPFWYINLISGISQGIQLRSLNQFWTKYFYLAGSMAGRSSFLVKCVIFKEIWDWTFGAPVAFYRQRSPIFLVLPTKKTKYIDL